MANFGFSFQQYSFLAEFHHIWGGGGREAASNLGLVHKANFT